MQKYMSHPAHGRMPVYSEDQIKYNEQYGWILDEEKPVLSKEKLIEQVDNPAAQYEKKYGKRPHHRMKLKTIIDALKE